MSERNIGLQSLLGAAGSIAGLLAMKYAAKGTSAAIGRLERRRQLTPGNGRAARIKRTLAARVADKLPERGNGDGSKSMSIVGEHRQPGEPATAALGRLAHEKLTGREPSAERKETLSYAVHWGYGVAMGALYGAVRGGGRGSDIAGGTLFGLGLWALGDEIAVPLLGLADKPTAYPLEDHVGPLIGHIAFGTATAAATHALGRLLTRA